MSNTKINYMHPSPYNGKKRTTRQIVVGSVAIGGGAEVSIQSMTNTDTRDARSTIEQIRQLADAGCELVRLAVPDQTAAETLPEIINSSSLPVIADVHFKAELAKQAINAGIHCLRINPGTISTRQALADIARLTAERDIPVRIGINAGSIEEDIRTKYGGTPPEALVESALRHCDLFERNDCSQIKVSLKSSSTKVTVAACRSFAYKTDYPIHLGVTEAGTVETGTVKSAVAIGTLLMGGIGDTTRVSLSAPPVQEIIVARRILEACGLREAHPEIISCPTCGRTEIDLLPLVNQVETEIQRLKSRGYHINLRKIAIMGCIVNGPGEAREADIGIAGGRGRGVLFKKGQTVATLPEEQLVTALLKEIHLHIT